VSIIVSVNDSSSFFQDSANQKKAISGIAQKKLLESSGKSKNNFFSACILFNA
jgi:hypothetical protein